MVKLIRLLILVPLFMAFQCEDDEINAQDDFLYNTGIFGAWMLSSQTINGITSLTPPPDKILEFYPDSNLNDAKGEYNLEEPMLNSIGEFQMDILEETITFKRVENSDIVYNYRISATKNLITFTFIEGDIQFEEDWIKR